MAKLENYKGNIGMTGGFTPKAGQTFPLMEAHDIVVDENGTRLDYKLANMGTGNLTEEEYQALQVLKKYIIKETDPITYETTYELGSVPTATHAAGANTANIATKALYANGNEEQTIEGRLLALEKNALYEHTLYFRKYDCLIQYYANSSSQELHTDTANVRFVVSILNSKASDITTSNEAYDAISRGFFIKASGSAITRAGEHFPIYGIQVNKDENNVKYIILYVGAADYRNEYFVIPFLDFTWSDSGLGKISLTPPDAFWLE